MIAPRIAADYPKVYIIVLNWNGFEDTANCLKSLQRMTYPNERYKIVVIDNGSLDGSGELLKEAFKDLTVILTSKNLGFSGGNNIGIRFAFENGADYIMMLNNDTVVKNDFLEHLVEYMEHNKGVGAVQPKLMRHGNERVIDSLGQQINKFGAGDIACGEAEKEVFFEPKEIFGPCAASVMFRKSVFEKVGFFNETFFMIYEDVDFSWRMQEKGFSSWLIPSSTVFHKRGVSGSEKNEIMTFHFQKNQLYLTLKYYPLSLKDFLREMINFISLSNKAKRLYNIPALAKFIGGGFCHRFLSRKMDAKIYERWISEN